MKAVISWQCTKAFTSLNKLCPDLFMSTVVGYLIPKAKGRGLEYGLSRGLEGGEELTTCVPSASSRDPTMHKSPRKAKRRMSGGKRRFLSMHCLIKKKYVDYLLCAGDAVGVKLLP